MMRKWKMDGMRGAILFMKQWGGRIGYYCGVALVLAAIAVAAERFRGEGEALVLPEAELAEVVQQIQEERILMPEGMELLQGFTSGPVWNRNLRQWQTHEAVDYAPAGGEVLCLEAGTVKTVGESGVYGGFVEVECGVRLYRYASVTPDTHLRVGQEIKAGDSLGAADASMPGERDMGAHLHLEVYAGGKATDLTSLL